jgi:hypothetical protein
MLKDRSQPPGTAGVRGKIAAAATIAPVFSASRAISQDRKRDRRNRLLNRAIERHGIKAVGLLLESLEGECGDIGIDRRLERLVDAEPAAVALLDGAGAAR